MTPMLIGKKIGMTQIFTEDGAVVPVTVINAGPCVVTQVKTVEKDKYNAIQLGFGHTKKLTKSIAGHLTKAGATSQICRENRLDDVGKFKVGQKIDVAIFEEQTHVNVSAISKGKGFAGVIKRHNFHRGPETHGSGHHRKPGSIGGMFPQRVLKGQKLPGHMGAEKVTVQKLQLVKIDKANNLLVVLGAIPGSNGSIVEVRGVA